MNCLSSVIGWGVPSNDDDVCIQKMDDFPTSPTTGSRFRPAPASKTSRDSGILMTSSTDLSTGPGDDELAESSSRRESLAVDEVFHCDMMEGAGEVF